MQDPRNQKIGGQDKAYTTTMHCGTFGCMNSEWLMCKLKFRK